MAEVKAKASLDSKGFDSSVKSMNQSVVGLSAKVSLVTAAFKAVGAVVQKVFSAVMSLVNFGSEMTDFAFQTGLSVESFQRMLVAVRLAGGQTQNLVNSMARLRDAQGAVITGDKTMTKAFEQLGISQEEVASLDMEGLMKRVATALTESGNSAKEFSAVVDLIGARNAPKLLEAFNLMAEGAGEFDDKVKVMSEDTAQRLDLMADAWGEFKNNVKVAASEALVAVVDFFTGQKKAEIASRKEAEERTKELEKQARVEDLRARQGKEAQKSESKKQKALKDIEDRTRVSITTNQAARAGALLGGGINPQMDIMKRALKVEEDQRDLLKKLADKAEESEGLAP